MRVLIIGDGVAGHTAAVELRKRDKDAEITILSDEQFPFYDRVGLKRLIEGQVEYTDLIKAEEDFYESKDIDLRLETSVKNVLQDEKIVETEDDEMSYDKLLIAAGGHLRKLEALEGRGDNVHYLWNMKDAKEFDEQADSDEKAVVIGGGFMGLEMAFALRKRNLDVDYLIREEHWGKHCTASETAEMVHSELEKQGVNLYTNTEAEKFDREDGEVCKVISNNEEFECDLLVVCIGLRRNLDFLKGSGIETNYGVLTDKFLETNKEDVFAAGDIAEYYDVILEENIVNGSWPSAKKQGEVVASNILGGKTPFRFVNAHNISHFNIDVMTLGDVWLNDSKEAHVEKEGDTCMQIMSKDNEIVGAVLVNDLVAVPKVKEAIKEGKSYEDLDLS